jgi:hypothetical protein
VVQEVDGLPPGLGERSAGQICLTADRVLLAVRRDDGCAPYGGTTATRALHARVASGALPASKTLGDIGQFVVNCLVIHTSKFFRTTLKARDCAMAEIQKVKHHYVPAFYLRGFIEQNGLVWVYSKGMDKVFSNTPENIGYKKHYHTFEKADGGKDTNTIEDYFCQVWEGPASKTIESIKGGNFPVGEDRQFFARFLGLSFTRSPNHRANVDGILAHMARTCSTLSAKNSGRFRQSLEGYERATGERLTDDPEKLRSFILDGQYEIVPRPEIYLQMFIRHGVSIGLTIEKMRWIFVRSTDRFRYLTSDNPFFFYDPTVDRGSFYRGTGLLNKNVELSFPIGRDLALIASWREDIAEAFINGTHELVKSINRRTILSAYRFIYASEKAEAIRRFVQKHAKNRPLVTFG